MTEIIIRVFPSEGKSIVTQDPSPKAPTESIFSSLCLPRSCGETRQTERSESAFKAPQWRRTSQTNCSPPHVSIRGASPARKDIRTGSGWPRRTPPFGSHLRKFKQENARARSPNPLEDPTLMSTPCTKRAGGPEPEPQPTAARQPQVGLGCSRPFPKNPRVRVETHSRRTPRFHPRFSRQKAGPTRGGGVRATRKRGGASRARALTEYPDAALRQSGPKCRAGNQKSLRGPSISIRVSRFKSLKNVLLHLTSSKGNAKGRSPAPLEAPKEQNKMATSASPFHPSPLLPATEVLEDPTCDRRPGPNEKQNPRWEGTRPRVGAPLPPHALTYHLRPCRRTGLHATRVEHHKTPTPRGLSRPAARVEVYVRHPLRTAEEYSKCGR